MFNRIMCLNTMSFLELTLQTSNNNWSGLNDDLLKSQEQWKVLWCLLMEIIIITAIITISQV